MNVELVTTETEGGALLHGALAKPESNGLNPLVSKERVIVLLLHGVGSNFYSDRLLSSLAEQIMGAGFDVLRANFRGHDLVNYTRVDNLATRQGAAYESVSKGQDDILGWVNFLREEKGYSHLLLLGHSLGAVKSLLTLSSTSPKGVGGVIAVSPPLLSYTTYVDCPISAPRYQKTFGRAEEMIKKGRGDDLIEVKFPFRLLITAAGYVEKYGPAENYNLLQFIPKVKVPLLMVYGGAELALGGAPFRNLPDKIDGTLRKEQKKDGLFDLQIIAEADHFYHGKCKELGTLCLPWLKKHG
ncbi:MAG: alpha/beta fold hydrolase [Pirellulaceae bacterium]|nr:alpha/beta fold hydrolase [Pirellulaceae bacterium]